MPRVTTHTARRSKYERTCTGCREPIQEGEQYYHWTRRVGPKQGSFRHVKCGPPRPTELTTRKTAQVEEAIQDASAPDVDYSALDNVDEDNPVESVDLDSTPFEDWALEVADVADQVADEYEEGVSNMPDSLQYSSQAEAMNEVAQELRDWADTLRDRASETVTVDLPALDDAEEGSGTTWRQLAEDAIDQAWNDKVSEVEDALGDMPEYQG